MTLRTTNKSALVLALVATVTLGISACGGGGEPVGPDPSADAIVTGGIIEVASNGEMPGFDPVKLTSVGTGIERAALVMDTLMYRDEVTDEVLPKLAEGLDSDDARTWVLTLREGVSFTDGTPLDAEAVLFNLERHIAEGSTSSAKPLLAVVDSMVATDAYEITFTLREPSGSFPLTFTAVTPAGLIGSPAALADPGSFNAQPVGAGPFKLESWTRDDKLVLVKNDDYFEEGKPYVDGVTFSVVPDPQTRADGLVAGGYDLVQLLPSAWASVSMDPGVVLLPIETGGAALVPNASRAPGDDIRVREAMFLAFDSETSMNVIFGDSGYFPDGATCVPFPSDSDACNPDAAFEQDLPRAKKLVADYIADGNAPPVLEIVYFQSQTDQVSYVQASLEAVGIETTLRSVDFAGLSEAQATGSYGAFWGATASAGYPTIFSRYFSKATNWGMVAYPELDDTLIEARDAVTLDERNAAWREASQMIYDNAILDWIIPYAAAMAHRKTLHLGSEERPYTGSTMVYLGDAWLGR